MNRFTVGYGGVGRDQFFFKVFLHVSLHVLSIRGSMSDFKFIRFVVFGL